MLLSCLRYVPEVVLKRRKAIDSAKVKAAAARLTQKKQRKSAKVCAHDHFIVCIGVFVFVCLCLCNWVCVCVYVVCALGCSCY